MPVTAQRRPSQTHMSAAGDVIVSAELLDGVPKPRSKSVKAIYNYSSGIAGDLSFAVGTFVCVDHLSVSFISHST
jgi:hypothetical protein